MSEEPSQIHQITALGRAATFGFIVILAGVSYFNIRLSLSISSFEQIFHDMLGSRPMPGITGFIVASRIPLIILSGLLPMGGLIIAATTKSSIAIVILSAFIAIAIVQTITTGHGLMAPLLTIVHGMQQM